MNNTIKQKAQSSVISYGISIVDRQLTNLSKKYRAILELAEFRREAGRLETMIIKRWPKETARYCTFSRWSGDKKSLRVGVSFIIKLDKLNYMKVESKLKLDEFSDLTDNNPGTLRIEFFGFQRFIYLQKLIKWLYKDQHNTICLHDSDSRFKALYPLKFEEIILEKDIKDKIINSISYWIGSSDVYKKHGMHHKLGIILYGKAGTGKTSVTRAIATMLGNAPIYNCTADNIIQVIDRVQEHLEMTDDYAVVVLEDMDINFALDRESYQMTLFNIDADDPENQDQHRSSIRNSDLQDYDVKPSRRRNYRNGYGLSRSYSALQTLLQFLDGNLSVDKTIIIGTTTRIDNLDPDVLRYGRFDVHIEFTYFDYERALEYVKLFGYDEKLLDNFSLEYPVCPAELRYRVLEYDAKRRRKETENEIRGDS